MFYGLTYILSCTMFHVYFRRIWILLLDRVFNRCLYCASVLFLFWQYDHYLNSSIKINIISIIDRMGYWSLQLFLLNCLFLSSVLLVFCFLYFGARLLDERMCIIVISSWWIVPLIIIQFFSWSLVTISFFKSILPDISINTPALFWILFACVFYFYFFHHFTSTYLCLWV